MLEAKIGVVFEVTLHYFNGSGEHVQTPIGAWGTKEGAEREASARAEAITRSPGWIGPQPRHVVTPLLVAQVEGLGVAVIDTSRLVTLNG